MTRETTAIAIDPGDIELVPFHDGVHPRDALYACRIAGHCMERLLKSRGMAVVDPRRVIRPGDFIVLAYHAGAADFEDAHPEDARSARAQIEADGTMHMLKQFVGYDGGELYARFLSPRPQVIKVPLRAVTYVHRVSFIGSQGLVRSVGGWLKHFPQVGDYWMRRLAARFETLWRVCRLSAAA